MAEESGLTKVKDIKNKLADVLISLDKLKQDGKSHELQSLESQIAEIQERASEIFQDRLESPLHDFSFKVSNILSNFNSDISTTIDNLQYNNEGQEEAKRVFIEKVHIKRSAPISKLLYSNDFRTLYNIFVAILVNFGVAEIAKDFLDNKDFLGIKLLTDNFGKFDQAIKYIIGMSIWSFISVLIVQQHKQSVYLLGILHLSSLLILYHFSVNFIAQNNLPIATSIMLACETVRISMKMHSYVREKLLHGTTPNEYQQFIPEGYQAEDLVLPKIDILSINSEISRFSYFLLCPTLIYRDTYPKIDRSIRWKNLSVHLFGFFGSIAYTTLIFKAFCVPEFRATSTNIKDTQALILSWFRSMLPGTMIFLLIFFAVMHSWFSIWAEVLNFADRRFYDDWWNSKDYGTFYRKISVIMYEWLHTYVFLDLQRFSSGLISQQIARIIVFFFSGIVCELILDISLGFFSWYIFAIISLPGAFLISYNTKRSRFFNVLMWTVLIMMMGLVILIYSLEHFVRTRFPDKRDFGTHGLSAYLYPQFYYQVYN